MSAVKTLLPDPSVTVYFDGLIVLAHNQKRRLFLAGIHIEAEGHELNIEVRRRGSPNITEWPKNPGDWDGSHEKVKAIAPLWLYVDSGQGRQESDFSAEPFAPDDLTKQESFGHVLDFDGLYNRKLDFRDEALAVLNVAQGLFYSAENTGAILTPEVQRRPSGQRVTGKRITLSSLTGADIDSKSDLEKARWIVFERENPDPSQEPFFKFKLEEGTHYDIIIKNEPVESGSHRHPAAEHFLQYYELFALTSGEKRFLVEEDKPRISAFSTSSPPCSNGRRSRSDNFS